MRRKPQQFPVFYYNDMFLTGIGGANKVQQGTNPNQGGFPMNYDAEYDRQPWKESFPAILTPADIMDILGIGKNTAYRLLASGQLKGFRIGRSWRITGDALEEFLMLR